MVFILYILPNRKLDFHFSTFHFQLNLRPHPIALLIVAALLGLLLYA